MSRGSTRDEQAAPIAEADDAPGRFDPFLDEESLDTLTERIVRRIMRLACAVGTLGILSAMLGPASVNALALGVSIAVTIVILALTFLPLRVRFLSVAYPWTLSLLGIFLTYVMGPRPDALLLATGGLFIGSLVLKRAGLILLVLATTGTALASAFNACAPNFRRSKCSSCPATPQTRPCAGESNGVTTRSWQSHFHPLICARPSPDCSALDRLTPGPVEYRLARFRYGRWHRCHRFPLRRMQGAGG